MPYIYQRAATERDKERAMRRLELAWKKQPAMRLGQLLVNVMGPPGTMGPDLFNIEDFALVGKVEEFVNRNSSA
jgi:hypothetical protein